MPFLETVEGVLRNYEGDIHSKGTTIEKKLEHLFFHSNDVSFRNEGLFQSLRRLIDRAFFPTSDTEIQRVLAPVLRKVAVDKLPEKKEELETCGYDFDSYKEEQTKDGTWGTYLEADILAKAFGIRLEVISIVRERKPAAMKFGVDEPMGSLSFTLKNSHNTHWYAWFSGETIGDGNCLYNAFAQLIAQQVLLEHFEQTRLLSEYQEETKALQDRYARYYSFGSTKRPERENKHLAAPKTQYDNFLFSVTGSLIIKIIAASLAIALTIAAGLCLLTAVTVPATSAITLPASAACGVAGLGLFAASVLIPNGKNKTKPSVSPQSEDGQLIEMTELTTPPYGLRC